MLWWWFISILLLLFPGTGDLFLVDANQPPTTTTICEKAENVFYDIVLGVSTVPPAECPKSQEIEMADFLERKINTLIRGIPGTVQTQNKLCSQSINQHWQPQFILQGGGLVNKPSHQQGDGDPDEEEEEDDDYDENDDNDDDEEEDNDDEEYDEEEGDDVSTRFLMSNHNFGRFIFAGGGRCRHCFWDSFDHRVLQPDQFFSNDERQLLTFGYDDDDGVSSSKGDTPVVAHASLCPLINKQKHRQERFNQKKKKLGENWENGKINEAKKATKRGKLGSFLGPFKPGKTISYTTRLENNENAGKKSKSKRKEKVIGAIIAFNLWAIDVPKNYTQEIFDDDPLTVYINDIKLDLSLLLRAPGVWTGRSLTGVKRKGGSAFAGITWLIRRTKALAQNHAFGSQKDIQYRVILNVPIILFRNKGKQIITHFALNRHAKARRYGFDGIRIMAQTIPCKVKGLDGSSFEIFQKVTEKVLKDKLGLHLAQRFGNDKKHCLGGKIPLVDVHLVPRTNWNNANPRCQLAI